METEAQQRLRIRRKAVLNALSYYAAENPRVLAIGENTIEILVDPMDASPLDAVRLASGLGILLGLHVTVRTPYDYPVWQRSRLSQMGAPL